MNNIARVRPTASREGTQWDNIVPNSENFAPTPETDWLDFGQDVVDEGSLSIAGLSAQGLAIASTNLIIRRTVPYISAVDSLLLISVYVQPVLTTGNDWCSLTIDAVDSTGAGGSAHGGTRFFDLDNGVAGIFTAKNTGVSVNHGIEEVDGGYHVWQLSSYNSADTGFINVAFRILSEESVPSAIPTGDDVGFYLTGFMATVGATGLVNYVPTANVGS